MKLMLNRFAIVIAIILVVTGCSNQKNNTPKNIIIFIGDGMGYNHVNITSYFQHGELGKQVYDSFPVKLGMSTFMIGGEIYNPDSVGQILIL